MTFAIEVEERAAALLYELPAAKGREIYAAILSLAIEPRPWRAFKLVGQDGCGLRVGDSWVLYKVNDADRVVRVIKIGSLAQSRPKKRP